MSLEALDETLVQERRRRLAAERLLAQKSDELLHANRQLATHADKLSYTVIEQRHENEVLMDERKRVIADLDIATEQAGKAERRLWDSLEAIGDGFAVYDRNWCLVAANRHYMRIFEGVDDVGLGTPFDLVLQVMVDEGLVDIADTDPDDWIDDMLARWEQRPIETSVIKLYNGRSIQIQDKLSSDGGIVSMCTDITDAIEREAAMRAAKDAAEAASRAKSAFLAKMSHEIRTPMNGVVGMAELLLESELDSEEHMYAETIRSSGEALLVIINDILDFSKLEAEKMEFRTEPVDLEALLIDLLRLSEASLADKPLSLALQYPLMARTGFITDHGKLRQILTNLIGNAIKFTPEGGVTVGVEIGAPDGEGRPRVKISVSDSGIGIPDDLQDHVFGEFNQVEDEKNRAFEGTGLGLAITKGIVERMNGSISLESTYGKGSCFTVTLPLEVDQAHAGPETADLGPRKLAFCGFAAHTTAFLSTELAPLGVTVAAVTPKEMATLEADALFLCSCMPEDEQAEIVDGVAPDISIILIGSHLRGPEPLIARSEKKLSWPYANKDLRAAIAAVPPRSIAPETPSQPETLRMLAAEDNKTNQFVFRKMLKSVSLDLTMVENGRLAVEAYLEVKPHVIFTDISMPEMDGMEAARAIRKLEAEHGLKRVPIVAMTAHAMEDDEDHIKASGIDHYLTKPLKKALLMEMLEKLTPEGITLFAPDAADAP
jgi:hypothetical protein